MNGHSERVLTDRSIEDVLASDNPTAKCMARLLATGAQDTLVDWVNAEISRPGHKAHVLLGALAQVQIQTFASVAAGVLTAEGYRLAAETYQKQVGTIMIEHARLAAKMLEAEQ